MSTYGSVTIVPSDPIVTPESSAAINSPVKLRTSFVIAARADLCATADEACGSGLAL